MYTIELAENADDDESRQFYENSYYEAIATAQEYVDSGRNSAVSINATSEDVNMQAVLTQLENLRTNNNGVKLPTITLPKFDGKYEEWLSFEDSFSALVHNNVKIQTVQKFNYLKSCLVGNAAQIIQSLSSTAENYEIAWNLLKERYSNKRIIIQNHVRALFELQSVSKESSVSLSALVDTALKHIHSLQALEQPVVGWDALLLHLIGSKVDKQTQMEWEKSLDGSQMPTFEQYLKFLRNRCHVLEAIPMDTNKTTVGKTKQVLFETQSKMKCHVCGKQHNIQNCEDFKAMSQSDKSEAIKRAGLCFNCFRSNHKVSACKASNCRKCDRKHHTLPHPVKANENNQVKGENIQQEEQSQVQIATSQAVNQILSSRISDTSHILLSTAVVDVADTTGEFYSCRIVLDAGSQSNFISEYCCNKLKLPKNTVNIPIKGIGETLSHVKSSTSVLVKSRVNAFKLKLNCLVIPRLTDVLPPKVIDRESLGIPKNLNLADPGFDKPSQIDILIGAEYFYHLLCVGQIRLKTGSTILQKTKFGWIVAGRTEFGNSLSFSSCHISRCSLDDAVQRFWEIEELPVKKTLSPEDENCEQYYKKTIERLPSGRYSVRLPFNEQKQELGESYGIAVKRLLSLERRLNTNLKLRDEYHNFLQEYQSLGHMTEIREPIMQEGCFLPHHSVIKESSVTTKLRVVFDASAKTTSGVSLNDTLFKGPVVQQDLFSIVLRFRLHDIVFTADIQKMYRQVLVHPDDHKFQRILWRNNSEEAIRVYELNTVTHGTSVAPYLATRTLIQLAENERQNYTDAVEIVTRDMYVDDLLTGTETLEQAKILKTQITKLLSSGGFELRQWASNHPQLIESQSAERQEHWCLEFSEMHKTLGILWNPQQDNFLYHFTKCQDSSKITKRLILSQIASYYDPLGLVGPVTVKTKILLQNIWKLQLSWDETVPIEIHTAWKTFQESMSELNNISFPRHVCLKQAVDLQLHGFADASEVAYGACVYMRSANAVNAHQVMLICSKSRVAPIKKKLSLPKLELCAALLLSQLCQTVLKAFHVTVDKVVLWSDSTIVLHWIHTHPYRLKTFVANRVTAIQEAMTSASWRHVSSQDNPADLLSRGIFPLQLINCTLWIHGPTWLSDDEQHWPKLTLTPIEIPEQRTTISLKTEGSSDLLRRFSSLVRLRRVVAWCLRFINNCRSKHKVQGNLISSELEHATSVIIKLVQSEAFSREIQSLEAGKTLKNNSKILSLHPFLDSIGILRVGGRLVHAKLNYDQRYQILLPGNHYITELIIQNAHISQLHAGPQTTLYHVRQKFWPVNAKGQVKKIVRECITCFKAKPRMSEYTMSNLPKDRFECSRPFTNSGVDYCGPFQIKEKKHRNRNKIKVYVAIFICLASKAVHLELVSDLSTEAFIAALKRFFSRRGKSNLILSDNATNFVGTKNKLRELYDFVNTATHKDAMTA